MKFIDDSSKNLKWFNRNFFYTGTITIVLINVLLFLVCGNNWSPGYVFARWHDVLNFKNILATFLSAFEHANLQHCLLNSLCFLIAGSYVERKIGTANLFVLIFSLAFFCECVTDANSSGTSHGFSGVNYGLYAYIIVDYVFMFISKKHTKLNIIYGAIILALIYLACCFSGGTSTFSFEWYPYDMITNMGHYTAFLTGLIMSILLQFVKWKTLKENK